MKEKEKNEKQGSLMAIIEICLCTQISQDSYLSRFFETQPVTVLYQAQEELRINETALMHTCLKRVNFRTLDDRQKTVCATAWQYIWGEPFPKEVKDHEHILETKRLLGHILTDTEKLYFVVRQSPNEIF